jgi:predicted phage terminase large subunit-like protein
MPVLDLGGVTFDAERMLMEINRARAEDSLVEFIKQAWHVIEPAEPYVHGWHIDFICEHLEAITRGEELDDGTPYNRLLANVPPGTMKSLIVNVFWPSWEWGPCNMPYLRYVCAAHKVENLSARDSRRMRQLITSDWYQARWGDRVRLAKDQNEKLNFHNLSGGFRIATAITSLTGIRGDRVIIDDPHSVDSASSEPMREGEVSTFLEAIPTRLTNPLRSAIVVIMQRLHERDISGVIIEKGLGYDHIMLPMRFDPGRAMPTKLGLEDPRQEEGELLFPARFPESVVDRDEKVMGPYATAGQFQQSPEPRGGGIIQRDWWQLWEDGAYPPMDFVVASLDTAYTTKQENDPSAMTVWGVFTGGTKAMATKTITRDGMWMDISTAVEREYEQRHPTVMLMNAWAERLPLHELVEKVAATCRRMRVDKLLIEDKAAGHSVAQEIRRLYGHEDWAVQLVNPGAQDKMARLYSVQHLFAEGMIHAPDRSWADAVINQCATFPRAKHDDLVDTTSMALRHLRETGMLSRAPEIRADISDEIRHIGAAPSPLYPV